jgi:exodeoxyribonuclease VII large subunit
MLLIDQFNQRLDEFMRQLQNYLKSLVMQKRQNFQSVVGQLEALSPLAILERGYSLNFGKNGQLIKDAKTVKAGDLLTTRLWKGILHSTVTKIEEGEIKK